jgi:RimJ/RimL family protein N-acetyltransferase
MALVPANAADARRLFQLRNDPFVIASSKSRLAVTWQEHEVWFTTSIARPDIHRIFFICAENADIGVVRLERAAGGAATISVYLLQPLTGRGIGPKAIAKATAFIIRAWGIDRVSADIEPGNERSRRAFLHAGYAGLTDNAWRLEYVIPTATYLPGRRG